MFIVSRPKNKTVNYNEELRLEKSQFELIADSMNLSYEYMGFIVPVNTMTKMNRWKLAEITSHQLSVLSSVFDYTILEKLY